MVCPVMGRACPVDAAGWDRSWWMYREQLDREQLALKAALNAPTTTGNACTGNARLPGGEGFPRLSRELLSGSGLSFGSNLPRCAVWPGAIEIGVPPRNLADCMEVQRRAQSSSSVRRRAGR